MRVHIQNGADDVLFAITPAQWEASAAGAGESGHEPSFGSTDAAFAAGIAEAEVLIGTPATLAGRFPCAAPRLKLIFCPAAGLDKLMPFDWLPPDVVVVNNRGVHGAKAGEYVAMALLMLQSGFPRLLAAQRDGQWRPHFAPTLQGRRVTVLGVGDLGSAAARQARHFGAVVTGVRRGGAPHPDFDRVMSVGALDEVLPASDFLVLACPLTPATRNLLDRRRLALLPRGAGVINIARGALLDQEALCNLLADGHLGGAVLDVFVPEPVPPGHRLWTTPNLLLTPHVSADNPERYNIDSLVIFFRNLAAWRAGAAMANRVDVSRGY